MPSRQVLDVLPLPSSPEAVALALGASPPFVSRRSSSSRSSHRTLILSLTLGGGGVCILLALVLVVVIAYLRLRASRTSPCDATTSAKLRKFSYKVLKAATSGFSDVQKLGQGGFGCVYKGVLCDGTEIAVKKLDASSLQGEQEFHNEVSITGCVNSPHIVNLLGFCAEGKHRLLVYTFMANGSLQEALFNDDCLGDLDWDKRFKIILDTARGLSFLHFMCKPPIIHGDVKPSNILLDSSFRARIADFGLSRLKSELQTPDASNEEAIRESIERERIRYERVARERARRQRRRQQEEAEMKKLENEQVMAISSTIASPGEHQHLSDAQQEAMSPQAGFSNLVHSKAAIGSGDVLKPRFVAKVSAIAGKEIRLDMESENFESAEDGEEGDQSIATSKEGIPTELKTAAAAAATSGTEEGEGEGWSTISTSQPDLDTSIESSFKEKHLLAAKAMNEKGERRSWSRRDWGWKQESSSRIGEISIREYIFDWRVGEESMKKTPNSREKSAVNNKEQQQQGDKKSDELLAHEEQGFEIAKQQQQQQGMKDSHRHRSKNSIEWLGHDVIGEEEDNTKKQLKKMKKRKKKKKTELKGREWWREEYCDELSSKSRELLPNKKGKFWKDVDSNVVNELGIKSNELRQQGRKKSQGEVRSGEVSQSKRLKARCDSSGSRHRSWSRDWWSGEFSGRGICSTPSMRGTICYVAPEYGGGGMLSEKSDVYSFGVLLLVIVSGRRPLQMNASSPFTEFERANLISWTRLLAQSGNTLDLVDPALQGIFSADEASLCIIVALLCLQRLPATRPNMEEIVRILSGVADVPALPLELSPSPPGGFPFKSRRKLSAEMVNIDVPFVALTKGSKALGETVEERECHQHRMTEV